MSMEEPTRPSWNPIDRDVVALSVADWSSDCDPLLCEAYGSFVTSARRHKSPIHFNSLPVEIIRRVLLMVPDWILVFGYRWHRAICLLQTVCRHWATIIESNAIFYSVVYVDVAVSLSRIESYTAKSLGYSTCIILDFMHSGRRIPVPNGRLIAIMTRLLPHLSDLFSRCTHVYMRTHDPLVSRAMLRLLSTVPAPMLVHMQSVLSGSLNYNEDLSSGTGAPHVLPFNGSFPRLTHLQVRDYVHVNTPQLYANLTSLLLLTVGSETGPTLLEFLDILRSASRLRYLQLEGVRYMHTPVVHTAMPVVLPDLTRLHLTISGGSTCHWMLQWLSMPVLHTMCLRFGGHLNDFIANIPSFTKTVKNLSFTFNHHSVTGLSEVVKAFPLVERVDIRCNSILHTLSLHAVAVHWPGHWPHLRELWMGEVVADEVMLRILTGLTGQSDSSAVLLSPDIRYPEEPIVSYLCSRVYSIENGALVRARFDGEDIGLIF
ncbi:hypothetical protein R3P38DRAFT_2773738 [Favolaschia claudopus]|uniref:F-box domain-containing protein n=1 Tax=Favolaschia claudopus TaxID=2862362 RepID=A0AAW0C3X9_9AGAR